MERGATSPASCTCRGTPCSRRLRWSTRGVELEVPGGVERSVEEALRSLGDQGPVLVAVQVHLGLGRGGRRDVERHGVAVVRQTIRVRVVDEGGEADSAASGRAAATGRRPTSCRRGRSGRAQASRDDEQRDEHGRPQRRELSALSMKRTPWSLSGRPASSCGHGLSRLPQTWPWGPIPEVGESATLRGRCSGCGKTHATRWASCRQSSGPGRPPATLHDHDEREDEPLTERSQRDGVDHSWQPRRERTCEGTPRAASPVAPLSRRGVQESSTWSKSGDGFLRLERGPGARMTQTDIRRSGRHDWYPSGGAHPRCGNKGGFALEGRRGGSVRSS